MFGVESVILIFEWRLKKRRQEKSISEIIRQFNTIIVSVYSIIDRFSVGDHIGKTYLFDNIFGPRSVTNELLSSVTDGVTNIDVTKKLCQHRLSIGIQMCNLWDRETFNRFFLLVSFWWPSENRTRYISVRSYRLDRGGTQGPLEIVLFDVLLFLIGHELFACQPSYKSKYIFWLSFI